MTSRTWICPALIAALAAPALADKPTPAQAVAAAKAWAEALDDDPAKAAPLTGASLYGVAYEEPDTKCKEATATTPAAIGKLLACLGPQVKSQELKAWPKGALKALQGPLSKHDKKLAALEGSVALVHHKEECAGQGSDLIVGVALEKGKDAKAKPVPKVVAVMVQSYYCGE